MPRRKPTFMIINMDEMINDLQMGVVAILFEKTDGSNRLIKATLQPYYFNKPFISEEEKQARSNWLAGNEKDVPVITVWDVEQKDWFSFRTDKILTMQLTNG